MIYLELFFSFLQIGLFSVGGGYASMPLIQAQVVTRYGWLTMSEFTDLITISQMTPGPIAINSATFIGIRIAGLPGAFIATFACILPSLFIVSILAVLYNKYKGLSALECVLSCLRPAVVSLIAAAGLSILISVLKSGMLSNADAFNWIGAVLAASAFFVLRKWKTNPVFVMTACGGTCLLLNLIWGRF